MAKTDRAIDRNMVNSGPRTSPARIRATPSEKILAPWVFGCGKAGSALLAMVRRRRAGAWLRHHFT